MTNGKKRARKTLWLLGCTAMALAGCAQTKGHYKAKALHIMLGGSELLSVTADACSRGLFIVGPVQDFKGSGGSQALMIGKGYATAEPTRENPYAILGYDPSQKPDLGNVAFATLPDSLDFSFGELKPVDVPKSDDIQFSKAMSLDSTANPAATGISPKLPFTRSRNGRMYGINGRFFVAVDAFEGPSKADATKKPVVQSIALASSVAKMAPVGFPPSVVIDSKAPTVAGVAGQNLTIAVNPSDNKGLIYFYAQEANKYPPSWSATYIAPDGDETYQIPTVGRGLDGAEAKMPEGSFEYSIQRWGLPVQFDPQGGGDGQICAQGINGIYATGTLNPASK